MNMITLNHTPKLVDINKLKSQWRCRKLTPIGRLEIKKIFTHFTQIKPSYTKFAQP